MYKVAQWMMVSPALIDSVMHESHLALTSSLTRCHILMLLAVVVVIEDDDESIFLM